ncbi:MAG TPA: hypothetical protein VFN88_12665 [Caulobacteraceae bacterium]|nr:hypothetical protein [Caulobacteraceae bacterium]
MTRSLTLGAALALICAAPALADDPPDMVAAARVRAQAAPETLARRSLAQVALPTIGTAKWRNVKAQYIREELVNDQIVFCGELDAVVPKTGKRSGWTRFAYIPGDPITIATETDGIGIHELGKRIVAKYCDAADAKWMSADYTADFQRTPKNLAEANSAAGRAAGAGE